MVTTNKIASLADMKSYQTELKIQIDRILVGTAITESLKTAADKAIEAVKNTTEEIKKQLPNLLAPTQSDTDMTAAENEAGIVECETALKIRQAIKICTSHDQVYWLWRLQPGEKAPENSQKV